MFQNWGDIWSWIVSLNIYDFDFLWQVIFAVFADWDALPQSGEVICVTSLSFFCIALFRFERAGIDDLDSDPVCDPGHSSVEMVFLTYCQMKTHLSHQYCYCAGLY